MKKYQLILAACMAVLLMAACGDDEDKLETAYQDPTNNFIPDASAADETSVLRREFYARNGSYLLFTDTLQHYQIGTDINGDPKFFTEMLNIQYSVGQTGSITDTHTYTYFTTIEEQRFVVDFLEKYVLTHITGKLRPFSWFLAKTIEVKSNVGTVTRPFAVTGQRAIVASLGQAQRLSESGRKTLATRILNTIIGQLVNNNITAFSEFFTFSESYYSRALSVPEGTTREKVLLEAGFISPATSMANFYYPTQKDDLTAYALMIISTSEEKLQQTYGQYPAVMKKFEIVRKVLIELGYVF